MQGGAARIPGTCWECGEVGHYSPTCPKKVGQGEYLILCANCREEGHKASQCTKPVQIRPAPRYVPTLSREQTALNWKNTSQVDKPGEEAANVQFIKAYDNIYSVATRRRVYDRG